jgi:DNA-binding transcriptional regulator YhcF (GntR family)
MKDLFFSRLFLKQNCLFLYRFTKMQKLLLLTGKKRPCYAAYFPTSIFLILLYLSMARACLHFDFLSPVPKYRQLVASIVASVESGILKKGEKLPSINQICAECHLSRDTVMLAFKTLKARGVVLSQPGKGYYIACTEITREEKICMVLDELNAWKETFYDSFLSSLESKATVDVSFHCFNYGSFKSLILGSAGNYTSYVIMPATFDNTSHLIGKLPQGKVYILDRLKGDLSEYSAVYQDFENDLYQGLTEGLDVVSKYKKLILVHPGGKEPPEREKGFIRFCREQGFGYETVKTIHHTSIEKGRLYVVISDRDLVDLVKNARLKALHPGRDIGIISLNDHLLKEVLMGGITTISTDYKMMGAALAQMIKNNEKGQIRNPSFLIRRSSA